MKLLIQVPLRLDLEITRRCKYKCSVCSVRATSESLSEVSMSDLKTKVLEFWRLGGKEISITGGEPSERGLDFLTELIVYCRGLNLKIRMYTVGYGFQSLQQVKILARAGLNTAIVSLEGDKKVDEIYKGVVGSFDVAIRAIELLSSVGIEVVIHFTPTKLNFKYLSHVVEIAKSHNVGGMRIMPFVPQGRGWDNRSLLSMNNDELNTFASTLENLRESNKDINFQISGCFNKHLDITGHSEKCTLEKNRLVITSDGLLIPSLALRMYGDKSSPNHVFNLGSVGEKSISDAWNSPIMLMSRNSGSGCGTCSVCSNST